MSRTTHIKAMLNDALRMCDEIEEEEDEDILVRLLTAASVQTRHASAELDDEWVRLVYPGEIKT